MTNEEQKLRDQLSLQREINRTQALALNAAQQRAANLDSLCQCYEDLADATVKLLFSTGLKDSAVTLQRTLTKLQAGREEINK